MAKVPTKAGSKIVREFVERLIVSSNRPLKYVDVPLHRPGRGPTKLKPDSVYTTGKPGAKNKHGQPIKYVYTTDSKGRLASAHARPLQLPEKMERGPHSRNTPGKEKGDHAGHLFADIFGGSGKIDNLVSQLSDVNLSKMRRLENDWASRLKAGETFDVDITVRYSPDGSRPIGFDVVETLANGKVRTHPYMTN